MSSDFTESELEAYVDESLDATRAAEIERALQTDRELLRRLSFINGRRDAGVHSLGEIWRQNQVGVPTREKIIAWIRDELPAEEADYLRFRVEILKCRFTAALLDDVRESCEGSETPTTLQRRKKILDASQRLLKPKKRRQ